MNLEAKASDGNAVFTPRQWLERFRQFTKREHRIDISQLLKGEDVTESGWTGKEQLIQEEKISSGEWDLKHYIPRTVYKTEPYSIKIKDWLFTEYYLSKRKTFHNRGDFFWAKQTEDKKLFSYLLQVQRFSGAVIVRELKRLECMQAFDSDVSKIISKEN